MIKIILFLPLILSLAVILMKNRIVNIVSQFLYALVVFTASLWLYANPVSFTPYFRVDGINILFLLVMAVLFLGISIYHINYMAHDEESDFRQSLYTVNLLLFIAAMAGVILSAHLALLWVFIEATTLASAFLIYYHRSDTAVEATWKYLFICSIGIAVAFIGIIFFSIGLHDGGSLFFDKLGDQAKNMNPFWLKFAFPFILVGFGTKAGLAPVHSWLPDAHSESPSPVSALLSGTLLNAAFLGILRVSKVMGQADLGWYVKILLLVFGFISLFVTAVYIGIVKNYKRMLAYSSIENMGIIAIGIGIGGAGVFAAMLHLVSHSLAKASLFLTSGNILERYKTREIKGVRGLLKGDDKTGWLWIFSFAAISGIPPSPIFISEFYIVKVMLEGSHYLVAALFFLLLTVIIAGMAKNIFGMCFGTDSAADEEYKTGFLAFFPQLIFLVLLIVGGVNMPETVKYILEAAASVLR